jgi:serine protease Do
MVLEDLSSEHKERLNVTGGVLVKQIEEGGARAGVIPGDVITMLHGQRIQSISHLLSVIKNAPKNKALPMRIVRRGSPLFVPIKLEE